jgi:hypothetical protein
MSSTSIMLGQLTYSKETELSRQSLNEDEVKTKDAAVYLSGLSPDQS